MSPVACEPRSGGVQEDVDPDFRVAGMGPYLSTHGRGHAHGRKATTGKTHMDASIQQADRNNAPASIPVLVSLLCCFLFAPHRR